MIAGNNDTAWTIIKVVTGGFLGTILTTYLAAFWDDRREQREALQNLVLVWHGGYIGAHRDAVTDWLLSPDGAELRGLSEPEYNRAIVEAFESNRSPNTAILAIAGFFRTVDICIRDERCDKDRTHAAFNANAWEYYNLFGPLLRHLDCELGYTGTEDPVLSVMRRTEKLPSSVDRCS